jgi:uncharacterized membrane protein YGL010W
MLPWPNTALAHLSNSLAKITLDFGCSSFETRWMIQFVGAGLKMGEWYSNNQPGLSQI